MRRMAPPTPIGWMWSTTVSQARPTRSGWSYRAATDSRRRHWAEGTSSSTAGERRSGPGAAPGPRSSDAKTVGDRTRRVSGPHALHRVLEAVGRLRTVRRFELALALDARELAAARAGD